MFDFLNSKVSTLTGVVVLIVVALVAGWLMLSTYINFLNMQFEPIRMEIKGE